jgi:hypothetical protein
MLHLLLPGHSQKNKEELLSISDYLKSKGLEQVAHEWLHWYDETLKFDMDAEIESILSEIRGIDHFGIIAKSIGTRVSVSLLNVLETHPMYLVLMGLPIKRASEKNRNLYRENLKNYGGKIFVIQNINDPLGSIEDVRELLSDIEYKEIPVDASSHRYNYPEMIFKVIREFEEKH